MVKEKFHTVISTIELLSPNSFLKISVLKAFETTIKSKHRRLWSIFRHFRNFKIVIGRKCTYYTKGDFLQLFHKILLIIMKHNNDKREKTLSFHSLATTTSKKLTSAFWHSRPLQFKFCHCESAHTPENFNLDTWKYRQIQFCNTSKIYTNNWKTLK